MKTQSTLKGIAGFIAVIILFLLGVYSISSIDYPKPPVPSPAAPTVSPEILVHFRSLYWKYPNLICENIRGTFTIEEKTVQAFGCAVLIHDPNGVGEDSIQFLPLGNMHHGEHPRTLRSIEHPDNYINDYNIDPGFMPYYASGAKQVTGLPISEPYRDRDETGRERTLQYFENVVIYYFTDDPPTDASGAKIYAYPLGKMLCAGQLQAAAIDVHAYCGSTGPQEIGPEIFDGIPVEFAATVYDRMQTLQLGDAIAMFSQGEELRLVMENIVFCQTEALKPRAIVCPAVRELGVEQFLDGQLVENYFQSIPWGKFDVPIMFSRYIALNGGVDFSGEPLSGVYEVVKNQVYRQCFENICLEYHRRPSTGEEIVLTPIGTNYPIPSGSKIYQQDTGYSVIASHSEKSLTKDAVQQLDITVISHGQEVVSGLALKLILTLPTGEEIYRDLSPTNLSGKTQVSIPYQDHLTNAPFGGSDLIRYRVYLEKDGLIYWDAGEYSIWTIR